MGRENPNFRGALHFNKNKSQIPIASAVITYDMLEMIATNTIGGLSSFAFSIIYDATNGKSLKRKIPTGQQGKLRGA